MQVHALPALQFLQLEVTAQCNLECAHCYTSSGPREKHRNQLTLEDYKAAAIDGFDLGARRVQLIGGEPALWPGTPDLLCFVRELGFEEVEYYSNLALLPRRVNEALQAVDASVAVTILSSTAAVHDRLTRNPGSWAATVRHVEQLTKTNRVRGSVILFPETESGRDATVSFVRSLGVQSVHVDRVRGVGRGLARVRLHRSARGTRALDEVAEHLCGRCVSGMAYVAASGSVHFCGLSREVGLGDVKRNSLRNILASKLVEERRQQLACAFDAACMARHTSACLPSERCSPDHKTPYCTPEVGTPRCGPEQCSPINSCRPACSPF